MALNTCWPAPGSRDAAHRIPVGRFCGTAGSYAMICRSGQHGPTNARQICRDRRALEFPVANWPRHPYTLRAKRKLSDAGFCSPQALAATRKATGKGIEETSLTRFRSGISCAFYEFRSHSDRTAAGQSSDARSPIGRGQMARRRTTRDAIEQDDCRFATLQLSAMTSHIGALKAELLRAPTPKPFASHCATRRIPVLRHPLVGARRRGVHYGYQENAGGCHPPGRNTDCRHSG